MDTITSAATAFVEDTSDYEFAHVISANLSGSYSFASANAAYDYVKKIRQTSDVILAIIRVSTTEPQLPADRIRWKEAPSSESSKINDNDERLHQFIADYGSHYIESIKYGYRMAVFGRLDTKTESEVRSFRASFKAAFSGGSAGGGLSDSQKEVLSSSHVELRAQVAAGDVLPRQSMLLYSFTQIYPFLEKVRNGSIKIHPGPIEANGKSYWHTLVDYPKTRRLLGDNPGEAAKAPFGVPAGTIIAWAPPSSSIRRDSAGHVDIVPPEGWAICNGASGTPNLSDRFVMGTATADQIITTGGAETHTHTGTTAPQAYDYPYRWANTDTSLQSSNINPHTHSFTTNPSSNTPPFVKLVYIMKQ